MKNLKKLYQIMKPLKWVMLLLSFLAIAEAIVFAATPWVYKLIIDNVAGVTSKNITVEVGLNNGIVIACFLVVIFLATNAIYLLRNYFTPKLEVRSQQLLRERIFSHVGELSIDYYEKERVGSMMAKFNRGIMRGASLMSQVSNWVASNILTGIFAIIMIFIIDWVAGLIVFTAVCIFLLNTVRLVKKVNPMHRDINRMYDDISGQTFEVVSGIHTVKSFVQEDNEFAAFKKRNQKWVCLSMARAKQRSIFMLGRYTVLDFARLVILVMAGFKALYGQITPGDVVLYISFINQIMQPLNNLTWVYDDGQEAMKSIDDVLEFLDEKPNVEDKVDAGVLGRVKGQVEFKKVGFRYHKNKKVLHDVSFTANSGESVALVGPSGTGKSTIAKLLARFYDATEGKIMIDGKDVKDVTQKSLRNNIGVVQQEAMLFNQTIKKNISYGTPGAKMKDIENAAKAANIHGFIVSLPDGYNTLVGERGIKLSGGEKQRVAIARALLKNPPILILDEATSHLDSKSEQLVQEAIWRLIEGRTTIIIAHRLATVMKADKIIVIKKGKIIEENTHKKLVSSGGLYEELFKIQSGAMLSDEE